MSIKKSLASSIAALSLCACTLAIGKSDENHLTDVGMFYVGGTVGKEAAQHSDQALVHYFKSNNQTRTPVIMYPGLGLSSYIYISTPDGRQGWAQRFARAGHAAYVYDPVDTGPSGFPASAFQRDSSISVTNWNINQIWPRWGFGEVRDKPYENVRFPVEHIDQFYASWPPRIAAGRRGGAAEATAMGMGAAMGMGMSATMSGSATETPAMGMGARGMAGATEAAAGAPTRGGSAKDMAALIELLERTGPALLMPHSMGGATVFAVAAKRPDLVKGIVVIEPVGCPRTAEQIKPYAHVPFLAVYGDYIESRGQTGRLEACRQTAKNMNSAGGTGAMLELTKEKIYGNTHILMQDNNSADIADRIIRWAHQHVDN